MNTGMKKKAIGMDIGGTNIRIAVIAEDGEVMKKVKQPVTDDILSAITRAIENLGTDGVLGIGIGIAGLIDKNNGRVILSPNLHAAEKYHLVREIREKFELPVIIENDANSAAFGESWVGAGRDFSNFFLFTLGTGIGGGIIYEKKLLRVSAEVGHMSINAEGAKCPCGNSGCLESYASARAILSDAVSVLEAGRESVLRNYWSGNFYKLTAEDIFKAALDGDTLAREVLKNAGRHLGIGIANVINLLSPEAVILSGGLIGAWDIYVREAIREASRRAFKDIFERVKIFPARLRDDAGIIGSAGLIFQQFAYGVTTETFR
jgi:glucokinase